jgi:hypothetical protein
MAIYGKGKGKGAVLADPSQWSAASQRSISFHYTKEYRDVAYTCRRCKREAVFSAEDQKHTYEVIKAPIDQRRVLCSECWQQLLLIDREIESCAEQWSSHKPTLARDKPFLTNWLALITAREAYVPYRRDIATKRMLAKLLEQLA